VSGFRCVDDVAAWRCDLARAVSLIQTTAYSNETIAAWTDLDLMEVGNLRLMVEGCLWDFDHKGSVQMLAAVARLVGFHPEPEHSYTLKGFRRVPDLVVREWGDGWEIYAGTPRFVIEFKSNLYAPSSLNKGLSQVHQYVEAVGGGAPLLVANKVPANLRGRERTGVLIFSTEDVVELLENAAPFVPWRTSEAVA
jgi:hypothetical protein